jgi:hypothetical protein
MSKPIIITDEGRAYFYMGVLEFVGAHCIKNFVLVAVSGFMRHIVWTAHYGL